MVAAVDGLLLYYKCSRLHLTTNILEDRYCEVESNPEGTCGGSIGVLLHKEGR